MICEVKGCSKEAIGEQDGQVGLFCDGYHRYKVCEDHAYPALINCKQGESGHGINIGWKRYKKMTEKEEQFKTKAEQLGYEVKDYSGRGMFGRICPSVTVDNPNDFITEMGMKGLKPTTWD
mgnify:FL=1